MRKPRTLTMSNGRFCLTAAALGQARYKRVVLPARVVGEAGVRRARLTGTAANSRVQVATFPLVIRGQRKARGAGVTG